MKSIEFTYWLQGALELSDIKELNEQQTQTIKNHLAMVQYHEKNNMSAFCMWLKGIYDMVEPTSFNQEQTEKIKNKLNECFEHVVPAIPQKQPNKPSFNPDAQLRC